MQALSGGKLEAWLPGRGRWKLLRYSTPFFASVFTRQSSSIRKTWTCWNECRGGHQDDLWAGEALLGRQAESIFLFSLEKSLGRTSGTFQYLKGL